MAALTAVGALISIPVLPFSPVPVSFQDFFAMLAGLILGPRGGALAVALYLTAGCLGLPVFVGGMAGLAVFLGPTGGYLAGFMVSAAICGLAGGSPLKPFAVIALCCALGHTILLLLGSLRLAQVMDISLAKALAVGFLPFVPGSVAKIAAAAAAYRFLIARRLVPAC